MPYVSATLAVAALTDLTVELLGKERARTTVVVQYVPGAQWTRGGVPLPVRGYFVEVKVTAGTNLRHDKGSLCPRGEPGAAIAARRSFRLRRGGRAPVDSWGYLGETQEFHYLKNKLA